jgi:hypothetical protein
MTIYRIIATMVAALAVPFVLLGVAFSGRPTLQVPCITIAANLYSRALLILTPQEREQYAKKLYATATDARQKGKIPTADLLDAFAAVALVSLAA